MTQASAGSLRVIGLCAAWCGVCREFQPAFSQVVRSCGALTQDFAAHWVDVEEPAISDALGPVDIDTFPTVAIGYGSQLVFWGAVVPSEAVLRQLIERLEAPSTATALSPQLQAAWQALCAHLWP